MEAEISEGEESVSLESEDEGDIYDEFINHSNENNKASMITD